MFKNLKIYKNFLLLTFLILIFFLIKTTSSATILKKIIINGNDRVSDDTITMFSNVKIGEKINSEKLNTILKDLYESNFFNNISVELIEENLVINVIESPIIEKIEFNGIKAEKIKDALKDILQLKSRSSYNEFLVTNDRQRIKDYLKTLGYYFADVSTKIIKIENNLVIIDHNIDLGKKAKIKKISFIGDKIFKDNKLKSLIVSEEYKFWKFISGRKYLNEQSINFDKKLLKNFYQNKGYYNVKINTSFAKKINDEDFELIFNVNANEKIFFNNLSLNKPSDFDDSNFTKLNIFFNELKGEPYSINSVNKILNQIDDITLNEEYKSINASVEETISEDKIDLVFNIQETEKFFVQKINVFGNDITSENVIRDNFEIDEGDPFNEILQKKTENNLKSLNFFSEVRSNVIDGEEENSKIINIQVKEKPTGEISAGAGFGTSGGTFQFNIKENNYLGKGLAVNAGASINTESFKGILGITNPNFNNSDKSVTTSIQAIEIDRMETNGYKNNKTGFDIGINFEYYDDLYFGLSTSSFYEKIETDSTASARQQSQEGNYWDTFAGLSFRYDKRNQKFRTDDGFLSTYKINIPVISETNTLSNMYSFKKFSSLYENNISSFSFFLESANSINGDDIKLTERIFLPYGKLRGFEKGKVGPKDGDDFIGGNFAYSFNANSTLPIFFENSQNLDASIFLDVANIWGVDYDSSIDESDEIRSSIGIGIDWFTPIGPLNFSFSEALSKADSDKEESFRFNLGTTF